MGQELQTLEARGIPSARGAQEGGLNRVAATPKGFPLGSLVIETGHRTACILDLHSQRDAVLKRHSSQPSPF
jgi:hypothetical protein